MSVLLDELLQEFQELEQSGTIKVKVISCESGWYHDRIGNVFTVYKKSIQYFGGLGYKCTDILGGIFVSDCEVLP